MKRFLFTTLVAGLVLGSGAASLAGWVTLDGTAEPTAPRVTVTRSDQTATEVVIDLAGFNVTPVVREGALYQQLDLVQGGTTMEVGKPELPVVRTLIAVPPTCQVSVEVLEAAEPVLFEHYRVYPFQEPTTDRDPEPPFTIDVAAYQMPHPYPGEVAALGPPGIFRDLRVVTLEVCPLRYRAASRELSVTPHLVVRLTYFGTSTEAIRQAPDRRISPRMEALYRGTVLNYDWLELPDGGTDEITTKYLIITTDAYEDELQSFFEWKYRRGLGADMVTLTEIGTTPQQIKDYISALYYSDGLEFVLLAGDVDDVPWYYWTDTYSDSWYTMIEGNDHYAELAIGRLAFHNEDELNHQLDKIYNYQHTPNLADNWVERSILVAHQEQYPGKYTLCKEQIRTFNYSLYSPIFDTAYGGAGATNQQVIDAINEGRGIVNYRGHGSETSWSGWSPSGDAELGSLSCRVVHEGGLRGDGLSVGGPAVVYDSEPRLRQAAVSGYLRSGDLDDRVCGEPCECVDHPGARVPGRGEHTDVSVARGSGDRCMDRGSPGYDGQLPGSDPDRHAARDGERVDGRELCRGCARLSVEAGRGV